MLRCFAAAAFCAHHFATVPNVRNVGSHESRALQVVGRRTGTSFDDAGHPMSLKYLILRIWFTLSRPFTRLPWLIAKPLILLVLVVGILLGMVAFVPYLFYQWLRSIWFRLFPPPVRRDVSRLGEDDASLDLVSEVIDDEGELLKESQHRRIYRDPRLLPKAKPPANVWPRPKRKRVMSAEQANRMFAATMRTRNRRIRDLLPDVEQLQRYGLPPWQDEQDLAAALRISPGRLRHYSIHRNAERSPHYVTFAIPKRSGGQRTIMAPKRQLKALQRRLLQLLVRKLPVSEYAHGFRRGRSVRTNAEPHVGRAVVLSMDLQDFFPSVTFGRVRGLLIALGYGYEVATTLAVLVTESERQPVELEHGVVHVPVTPRHCVQGAPTSPGICNAICLRLDRRLAGLAAKYDWRYSRYADDITFSGDSIEHVHTMRRLVRQICKDEGFTINERKTRVARRSRRQTVTGVVVNDVVGLSRRERRRLRAAIHRLNQAREEGVDHAAVKRHLLGRLAYLKMLNPAQSGVLARQFE
jgi:RNA-directed DNA polymerase